MRILELTIILFVFLGWPICVLFFGWNTIESESVLGKVHPIFYLLLIYTALNIRQLLRLRDKFVLHNSVIIFSIIFAYGVVLDRFFFSRLIGGLLVPLLFTFFIHEISKKKSRRLYFNFFISLFVLELLLAIYERFTGTLLFSYALYNPLDINGMVDAGFFRSNSLLGHPLSNALCVSVVLTFVATSELKAKIKYPLLVLGFIALLCFNARFAIVISVLSYVLHYMITNKSKIKGFFVLTILGLVFLFVIINFNLGDRLLGQGIKSDDDSILARLEILKMLDFVDVSLLYKGLGFEFVEAKLGLLHVENWFLMVLFDTGLLVAIYFVYLIFKIAFLALKNYIIIDKLYIFGVFIVIASSNNSLATQVPALLFLVASSFFFKKSYPSKIYNNEHENFVEAENKHILNYPILRREI